MHQPLISTRVALTLLVALWGFAGRLDQPLVDEPFIGEEGPAEVPRMHLRCVTASSDSAQHASRPVMVSFAPDSLVVVDAEFDDAALLRCRIVN